MKILALIVVVIAALVGLALQARRRQAARARLIDGFRFPPGIRERVRKRYPHLSDDDLDRVMRGLASWFQVCNSAGRKAVSMPSQAVDAAWHEFILFTRNYRDFCSKALGRFLHHTPAEAMRAPAEAQEGIRRAWRLACAREGIDPRAPARLPLLFALDAELAIPDGLRYALDCGPALAARPAGDGGTPYCASHIGCGSGGGDGGCASDSGCSSGCGGGGGD
jgi:hypothetical protein